MGQEMLSAKEGLELVSWFGVFLGEDWVEGEIIRRNELCRKTPYWRPERVHPNHLIDLFAESRLGSLGRLGCFQRLVKHAADVRQVCRVSGSQVLESLRELLRNRRKVEGYLYQSAIAAHYLRDGYTLSSFSVGGANEGDVVVGEGEGQVELQCKSTEYGAHRRIRNDVFGRLAARVMNRFPRFSENAIITVECTSRLEEEHLGAIADRIGELLLTGTSESSTVSLDDYRITAEYFDDPIPLAEVARMLERDPSAPLNPTHGAILGQEIGGESRVRLLLKARSQKKDRYVRSLMDKVKVASRQLSGEIPGVVFVHIPESIDWGAIKASSRLVAEVRALQPDPRGEIVNALVFTSEGRDGSGFDSLAFPTRKPIHPLPERFRLVGSRG